jgi:hypothetical protein
LAYGIVVSSALAASTYYHSLEAYLGMRPHVTAHLAFAPLLTLGLAGCASAGLALGRRGRRAG